VQKSIVDCFPKSRDTEGTTKGNTMSQNAERAAAVLRIRKLINQTTDQGRTEHEASMAMEQMSRLMETFNLTTNEVDLRGQEYVTLMVGTGSVKKNYLSKVAMAIAAFTDCRVWIDDSNVGRKYGKKTGEKNLAFFGAIQDTEMAEFLVNLIRRSVEQEQKEFQKTDSYKRLAAIRGQKRSALHSFQLGMAHRLSFRLSQLDRERKQHEHKAFAEAGTTDLVFLKSKVVEDEFAKMGMKLRKSYTQSYANNSTGYSAGSTAGEKVNLSRPLNTDNTKRTLALT
jgi:hypothetical protein